MKHSSYNHHELNICKTYVFKYLNRQSRFISLQTYCKNCNVVYTNLVSNPITQFCLTRYFVFQNTCMFCWTTIIGVVLDTKFLLYSYVLLYEKTLLCLLPEFNKVCLENFQFMVTTWVMFCFACSNIVY